MKSIEKRFKEKKLRKRKGIQILSAITIVFILGISIGIFWGNVQEKEEQEEIISTEAQIDVEQLGESSESVEEETVETPKRDFSLLQEKLEEIFESQDGIWSVYIKDLETQDSLSINNQEMYAASLSKLYVMESCYQYMEMLAENESLYLENEQVAKDTIKNELKKMIEQSDNESYNDLICLHSKNLGFEEGCTLVEEYVKEAGYQDTGIFHTLSPSETDPQSISDIKNHTSVEDCGKLLEAIYYGECVSSEASQEMLELLKAQDNVNKIPAGVPENIQTANKTGETEEVQHDAAIVYGKETDYILCVMSTGNSDSEAAIRTIQKISSIVYSFLNK